MRARVYFVPCVCGDSLHTDGGRSPNKTESSIAAIVAMAPPRLCPDQSDDGGGNSGSDTREDDIGDNNRIGVVIVGVELSSPVTTRCEKFRCISR